MFRKKSCPKCDSQNLNKVKPGNGNFMNRLFVAFAFAPLLLFMKKARDLNVCRDCGFSWEDR